MTFEEAMDLVFKDVFDKTGVNVAELEKIIKANPKASVHGSGDVEFDINTNDDGYGEASFKKACLGFHLVFTGWLTKPDEGKWAVQAYVNGAIKLDAHDVMKGQKLRFDTATSFWTDTEFAIKIKWDQRKKTTAHICLHYDY